MRGRARGWVVAVSACTRTRVVLLAGLLVAAGPALVEAQADSVTVQAGARYGAGSIEQMLLGTDYRQLWTAPVRVPVLDPDTFAGGLTPLERGGGRQGHGWRGGLT